MSKYSYEYLAGNVKASTWNGTRLPWWAKGDEPNLYPGPIPFEDVQHQLASWEPVISRILDEDVVVGLVREGWAGADLIDKLAAARVESDKLIKTDEGSAVVGIDYTTHLYGVWLTGTVREVLGDEAIITSSGLLDSKMQAWVCIERPEVAEGPGGVKFSPFITFSTSLNATMSTQINQNTILPICDNTVSWARTQGLAFRHTSGSGGKLGTYRSVAQALVQGETDFRKVLDELLATEVPEKDFSRFLERFLPIDEDDKPRKSNRTRRVRQEITQLYRGDDRVKDFRGTAFGVVQAVNTWQQHMSTMRNTTGVELDDKNLRAMRNYGERMRASKKDTFDEKALKVLLGTVGRRDLIAA